MDRTIRAAFTLLLMATADAHAVQTSPTPRPASGMQGTGSKITPFADAREYGDNGCGGSRNGDPGVQTPTLVYQPGDQVTVTWDLTIPHNDDNLDSGIRIAIHYGPGDSFAQNILIGGVVGSGNPNTVSAGDLSATVTLPNKECEYCTLQWIWSANGDGGSYIGCTDISIQSNGQLPNFASLPSEAGNVLPGVAASAEGPGAIYVDPSNGNASPPPPGGTGGADDSLQTGDEESSSTTAIAVVLVIVLAGGGYYYYKKKKASEIPPPPPDVEVTSATTSAAAPPGGGEPPLPEDWTTVMDEETNKSYYYNTVTGKSRWDRPDKV
jgi:LPXTG-motif cell wall-anchored protein